MKLRSALHRRGWRFRVDLRVDVGPGRKPRPDIVFTRVKIAVFVDGCFWHSCPLHGSQPKTNAFYWQPKLSRNVERDQDDSAKLEANGWLVVRIWEHTDLADAVAESESALRERGLAIEPQSVPVSPELRHAQ